MTDEQIRALARTTAEKLQWPRLDPAQETDEQIIAAALRQVREAHASLVQEMETIQTYIFDSFSPVPGTLYLRRDDVLALLRRSAAPVTED